MSFPKVVVSVPLREPSGLGLAAVRAMILQRSEGTIGEVAALLAAATETALANGLEQIDVNSIETASYQPPTVRRRTFEREFDRQGRFIRPSL